MEETGAEGWWPPPAPPHPPGHPSPAPLGLITSDEPTVIAGLINNGLAGKSECELKSVVSGCHAHVCVL